MMFATCEEAIGFYKAYAHRTGFSVRKRRTNKRKYDPSCVRSFTLVCCCEGNYHKVKTPQKRRENRRCNCMAEFHVQLSNDKYELIRFTREHTHDLVPPDCTHLLRSQRNIKDNQLRAAGIKPSKISAFMAEVAGGAQKLNFTQSDCYNFLNKKKREFLKEGDVKCLSEWFKEKKRENKHFFSSFWIENSGEVRGVFFCDAKSGRDYGLFGDAIFFDTTFKTNNYNMVCAPFVGVNHHWQTTIFGCGLVEGETTEAIVWLFTTFLEAMGGKAPQVIFTDQAAIANAINTMFPDTHHRLCLWHIYQNAAKHLASTFSKFKYFAWELKQCIYNPETITEFEECWSEMLKKFELTENEYLQRLFAKREKWALVYGRAHFCAGMTTTQRSESINKFLKDYFGTTIVLREFVDQYTKAMNDRREKERIEEKRTKQTSPILFGTWELATEASKLYTKKLFYIFQEEYKKLGDLRLKKIRCDGTIYTYSVLQMDGKGRPRTLSYDESDQSVDCTCKKFEFEGILCCHALKLFRELNFKTLPSKYYLKRWTREITVDIVVDTFGEAILNDIDPLLAAQYGELSHIAQRVVNTSVSCTRRYSLAKKVLLELQEKIDAITISHKEPRAIEIVVADDDVILQDPKGKKIWGEQKGRKKPSFELTRRKKNNSKKDGKSDSKDKNMVISQSMPLPNLNETPQELLSNIVLPNVSRRLFPEGSEPMEYCSEKNPLE